MGAVIHTHSTYATAFAISRTEIPVGTSEFAAILGGPVKVARFAPAGTEELGRAAMEAMGRRDGVLLRNHGVLAVGANLGRAIYAANAVERGARLAYLVRDVGEFHALPEEEQTRERNIWLTSYGQ